MTSFSEKDKPGVVGAECIGSSGSEPPSATRHQDGPEQHAAPGTPYGELQEKDERGFLVPPPTWAAIVCPICAGLGNVSRSTCPTCAGAGAVKVNLDELREWKKP